VIPAIEKTDLIILCPSNPILSIRPILAIPDIRNSIAKTHAKIVGISPIVGGKAIKGPLDQMMESLGLEVSPFGVAQLYKGLMRGYVIDEVDRTISPKIASLGMRVIATKTVMDSDEAKAKLAENTLKFAETIS
jgi:LPPG:FO 2-phospho-L-lactate transferase